MCIEKNSGGLMGAITIGLNQGQQQNLGYQDRASGGVGRTLAQQLDQRISKLQHEVSELEALKRKLGSGAALDTDINTLRAALG